MQNIASLLNQALTANNIRLDETAKQKLIRYLELLQTWNRVFNLTAITEPREMVYLHLIDSLAVQPFLHGQRMLDVGSGAGLPGIPLAIAHPEQTWVLLDKNNKKTRFMTQAISELDLKNAETAHARCEDFHPALGFDSILSRAYATQRVFVESTADLLSDQGRFIAMKGKLLQEAVRYLPADYVVEQTVRVEMKGMDVERHVVCLSRK